MDDQQPAEIVEVKKESNKVNTRLLMPIILVLILVIAALTTMLLMQDSDTDSSANESVSQQETTESTDTADTDSTETIEAQKVEENVSSYHVTYTNADLGFSFDYPASWGDVVVTDGIEKSHLVAGDDKLFSFSNNPLVTAGVRTSDWTHNDGGHDGRPAPGVASFTDGISNVKQYTDQVNIYSDTDSIFGYVQTCYIFCSTDGPKTLLAYIADLDAVNVDAIEFYSYGSVFTGDFTTKDVGGGWDEQKINAAVPSDILPKTDFRVVEIEAVAASIKTL
ncbi:MAG: hypothetical protein ACI9T8_000600 [Candidatus Saccharimonadales bacterium]|jgi:hypothetical protein